MLGYLLMWWPAILCVPLASIAAGHSRGRLRRVPARIWIAASALACAINFAVLASPSLLVRDVLAAAFFGALAPLVARLAAGQTASGDDPNLLQRVLACVPGWIVIALAPLGILLVHCTSGDCL